MLRTEQRALGVEEGQVAIDADPVATLGQTVVVLVGRDEVTLRLELLVIGLARSQAVGHFLEGGLNRLLVVGDADFLLDFRVVQAGAQVAGVEDRDVDAWLEQPGTRPALEQAGQLAAAGPGTGRQADAREERCTCCADVGVGRLERVLGLQNVRTTLQQVGRQACRHFGQHVGIKQVAGWQVVRQAGAEQQHQAVLILGNQALVLGQFGARAFDGGARLAQVQCRRNADFAGARGQTEAFFVGLQGVLRQLEQFLVGLPGHVGIGDAGHQTDLGTATCFLTGEVGLQRLLAEAAYPTEEVQLVRADTQGGRVAAGDAGLTGLRLVGRHALT